MLKMYECTRKTTCYDCDNEDCFWSKKKIADCPKMECDNDDKYACNNCKFIDEFIEEERNRYKNEESR